MNYQEALQFLNSLPDYEKISDPSQQEMKLERVEKLLELLDNPHKKFKSIHIAGTKGKGSTCVFLFNILKEAGFRVGLYTSPHLLDIKERIKVTYHDDMGETRERLIEQGEMIKVVEQVKAAAETVPGLTFFEIYTAVAFCFFAERKVDFAVIETGLGGRLDATNVIKPLVCGFTNISFDHTALLGKTLDKIAREKAGIIKDNGIAVSVSQSPDASRSIKQVAEEKNARIYEVGVDFVFEIVGQNLSGSIFDFRGVFSSYQNLQISLLGQFQVENAALALAIIELLRMHDIVISLVAIKNGLKNAHWPGRLHVVHKDPFFVVDGAQNAASAKALKVALNALFVPKKIILIFGASKDKDVEGIIQQLIKNVSLLILTQAKTSRAMPVDDLEKRLEYFKKIVKKTYTVSDALEIARANLASCDDLVVVTGSLYLVGEVFSVFKNVKIPKFPKG